MNWIRSSERLPEKNQRVLIYILEPKFFDNKIEIRTFAEAEDYNGDMCISWVGDGLACVENYAFAWMPLPEPPTLEDKK